ncbi:MAG TPA: S8 family serine peptidase [Pyrinomonadaceae bacterium]|nr:S8 family serine peptidase [Pyrinomonadaceae bacterium]
MKKALLAISTGFVLALLVLHVTDETTGSAASLSSTSVDPALEAALALRPLGGKVPAVITYSYQPGAVELGRLTSAGITTGFALQQLPMVITDLSAAQLAVVRNQPGVISVWGNPTLENFSNESRRFIGVPQMSADAEIAARNTNNPGAAISGKGIGIGYVDTGIDATQKDLEFGTKTVQNVQQPLANGVISTAGLVNAPGVSISDLIAGTGFIPPIYIENVPTSDIESGHGTHGAGVAAGTGSNSGGFYGGVAAGANLIGVQSGDDKGLPLVAILGAFDYLLANQFAYNIRVINNSWGSRYSAAGVDPNNPINVATRTAHDRNIVVVFAAGNAGDTPTSINPYSTMAWTISVAAGEKQGYGSPASFSSRGVDNGTGTDTTTQPAAPDAPPNLRPDITAPGVAIVSVRAHGVSPLMTASGVLNNDAQRISPAFLPNYLSSQGTSFASPHVAGVVALMLEANPVLTPAEVVTILRETATPMPYEQRVVGAGYVDAHNAVRKVLALTAVPHPADLFRQPGDPEIFDVKDDQLGTSAQDIREGRFAYDAESNRIIYTLTLTDLSVVTPNMRWTMTSTFGTTDVFVTASIDELGTATFNYGRITTLATGTRNQETIGAADSGEISGNQVVISLGLDKIDAAVGSPVFNTTSTNTRAQAQILIGTSVTGGLLLNADSASGADFKVGIQSEPTPTPTPTPEPTPGPTPTPTPEERFRETYSGTLAVGQGSTDISFSVRRSDLEVILIYHPHNEDVFLQLVDQFGQVIASSEKGKFKISNLSHGNYIFRVFGTLSSPVDFTIRSTQYNVKTSNN